MGLWKGTQSAGVRWGDRMPEAGIPQLPGGWPPLLQERVGLAGPGGLREGLCGHRSPNPFSWWSSGLLAGSNFDLRQVGVFLFGETGGPEREDSEHLDLKTNK